METSNGVPLLPEEEREILVLRRVSEKHCWVVEGIYKHGRTVALEYKLRSQKPQADGGRAYCFVQGTRTQKTDQQLEAHFDRQLQNPTVLKTA
jgi:hypothetical protein